MRLDAQNIDEYFEAAGDREADLMEVDRIIAGTAPELKRQLFAGPSITMIGYGEMSWERRSGSGVWPLLGVAAQKQYISIYVAAEKDGETLADHYRERLGKTNNGKNCIRFRRVEDIDPDELANAVNDAIAWAEVQERQYGRNCAVPVKDGDPPDE
jgi:hypothetical protein